MVKAKTPDGRDVSTLAVERPISDRVRELAKKHRMSTLDMTNQLLDFAMNQAKIEIEVRTVVLNPIKRR